MIPADLAGPDPEFRELLIQAARRRKADREFEESIRLDSTLPALTENDIVRSVQSGRGLWRPLGAAEQERAEREAREAEARREIGELVPIPEVEL